MDNKLKSEVNGRILTLYFALESVLEKFEAGTYGIFENIAAMYGVTNKETVSGLYALTKIDLLAGIDTSRKAMRAETELDTCLKMGIDPGVSDTDAWALLCKSSSLRVMEKNGLLFHYDLDGAEMIRTIEKSADNGEPTALMTFGFLLANGIGVAENRRLAMEKLAVGEQWGDLNCCLMLIYYDSETAESAREHLSFFKALCNQSVHTELYRSMCAAYPGLAGVKEKKEVCLIPLYLTQNKDVKNANYNAQAARVAYSRKLSFADKEKILSQSKDKISLANELPLEDTKTAFPLNYKEFTQMPIRREKEIETIWEKLAAYDMNGQQEFVPLLLVCRDKFVMDIYKEKIAAVLGFRSISETDADAVAGNALESGRNNLLVRALSEYPSGEPMIVFDNVNNVRDEAEKFGKLLRVKNRRSFALDDVGISLDLSETVILLTATRTPHPSIVSVCDTVNLDAIKENEKAFVLDAMLKKFQGSGKDRFGLNGRQRELICKNSAGVMHKIIKKLSNMRHACALKGETLQITDAGIRKIAAGFTDAPVGKFGFNRTAKTGEESL